MGARDLNKREFLMLAGTYDPESHDPTGWFMSEKLDGMRCFWDGGISRGLPAGEVPYANCANGGEDHVSTGLWSRGGKVVHAPEWFVNDLPPGTLLDGELWARGIPLQDIVSVTRAHNKEEGWHDLHYMVFEAPSHPQFFRGGRVHMADWEVQLPDMKDWAVEQGLKWDDGEMSFADVAEILSDWGGAYWEPLKQVVCKGSDHLNNFLSKIISKGGEGVMLRNPKSQWNPRRDRHGLLKVKKFYDAEAVITGYTFGKETKKDSRLRGMIGALVVKEIDTGHEFELAGLNDSERQIEAGSKKLLEDAKKYAWDHPGDPAPDWISAASFQRGQKVTFKYWDRTKDGVPKFAVYYRPKLDE